MALSSSTSQIPLFKHQFFGTSQNLRTLNLPTTEIPRCRLISSFHTARSKSCSSPLRTISCVAGDDGTREASSLPTSISSVFVKGFSDSVSEGRLKKVFSEFGQVTNVKIIVKERTRQSLGYGYVWFNRKEDAQLAVDAMNGKFFDGRFILVKFGQPGLSRRRRPHAVFFAASIAFLDLCCGSRSRKCRNPKCKGLKKAMEFDLQLQTEECVKSGTVKEIDRLPWKGGSESNPDYECLRAELRKMAPVNGRAVLIFRSKCGCPIAKLEGWGPKRGRRHKK
ncbi:unnamed protein product [Arabidopsis arenosa]|uniref:RRM domain-containing protein n=1 Tax=Arabidopsis arenosa TaxID=38785 RepID=A0A8S2AIT1_ARAAE|nr:unnamed protein product [Arabidopsis arenosa]